MYKEGPDEGPLSVAHVADSQSSVNTLHRITYKQPCLVSMDDSPFSINTMLSAFLSPAAIETLSGLQSSPLPLPIFLGLS